MPILVERELDLIDGTVTRMGQEPGRNTAVI